MRFCCNRSRLIFWIALLASALALLGVFELTDADLWIQDWFFNFETRRWLLPEPDDAWWAKAVFYLGPKVLIIAFAASLLVLLALPRKLLARLPAPVRHWPKLGMLCVLLTLAAGPGIVAALKATTNVHYPRNTVRYGGTVPNVRTFERFADSERPAKRSKGFPAGHSSGGFALMSLAALASTRRGRRIGIAIGLAAGWWMGGYQMLCGNHYMSHTLVTMAICGAVAAGWHVVLGRLFFRCSR